MSVRCTRPPTIHFTQVRNEWIRDRRLSYKARGLLTYLHSHQEGYELSFAQIVRDGADGKDAVRTGLVELETAGYLTRLRDRDGGRWGETDYVLADPYDSSGRLLSDQRETRQSPAADQRETRQSGLSAPEIPRRESHPLEDQGENTTGRTSTTPLPPASGGRQLALVEQDLSRPPDPFDSFWSAYPRRVGKDAARRAWGKATRRATAEVILAAVQVYPFDTARPQFIPHPATWLNGGRWADDPAAVTPPSSVSASGYSPRTHAPYRDQRVPGAYEGPI